MYEIITYFNLNFVERINIDIDQIPPTLLEIAVNLDL